MSAEPLDLVSSRPRAARRALTGWAVLVYAFLFLPIVLLVLFSFNANRYGTLPITGLTLHWYEELASDYGVQQAVWVTLEMAVQVTIIATVVGTAAAFPLVRSPLRHRAVVQIAVLLPIMIPGLLIGVALLTFLTSVLHVQLSKQTAVLGQAVYTTPFVILVVASRLQAFDRRLEVAAGDLGANRLQQLRHVVLPLIGPAIFAGAMFAFTLSLDEFIITLFLIGGDNSLPIYIYTQVRAGITPSINAVATLLLLASLLLGGLAFALPAAVRRIGRARRSRSVAAIGRGG